MPDDRRQGRAAEATVRLRYYHAPTVSAAMQAVREELGDDAIIVSTQEQADGEIRITAAIEDLADIRNSEANGNDAGLGLWREDEDLVDAVYQAFRSHGVPAAVGEPLLDIIGGFDTGDPHTALAAALRQTFGFAPLSDPPWTRPLMPVGPPGAGKTQTLAKLAAKALLEGRRVAVMTTDIDRTGGISHLRAFCNALKTDLMVAEDARSLEDALVAVQDYDLVLIDSSGRNHHSEREMRTLSGLLLNGRIEPILVFPAGTDAVEAGDMAAAYRQVGATRMVITRLDMTRRLGSVLAAAHAGPLAFAELATTAWIRDGLDVASAKRIAKLLLPLLGAKGRQTSEVTS